MITNPKSTSVLTSSLWRRILCSLFLMAAVLALVGAIGSSRAIGQGRPPVSASSASKIAPWVMDHTANGQQAEFLVVLADQADISGAASLQTKAEKGRYVFNTLLSKAQNTQQPIVQL